MKNILILLISIILFAGSCNVDKRIARKCEKARQRYELANFKYGCGFKTEIDSIFTHTTSIVTKDTTIYVPIFGDTVTIAIHAVEGKRSELKTKYAVSVCWIDNDSLYHVLRQIQDSIPKRIPGAIKVVHDSVYKEIPKPYPVYKPVPAELGHWQTLFIGIGKAAFFTVLAYFLYVIIRFLIKKKILKF